MKSKTEITIENPLSYHIGWLVKYIMNSLIEF